MSARDTVAEVADAYVWGLPLVTMHRTCAAHGGVGRGMAGRGRLATAADRTVVAPNNDTLYASGWFDLRCGDLVVDVGAMDTPDRYWSVMLLDAYTNVSYVCRRLHGTAGAQVRVTYDPSARPPAADLPVRPPDGNADAVGRPAGTPADIHPATAGPPAPAAVGMPADVHPVTIGPPAPAAVGMPAGPPPPEADLTAAGVLAAPPGEADAGGMPVAPPGDPDAAGVPAAVSGGGDGVGVSAAPPGDADAAGVPAVPPGDAAAAAVPVAVSGGTGGVGVPAAGPLAGVSGDARGDGAGVAVVVSGGLGVPAAAVPGDLGGAGVPAVLPGDADTAGVAVVVPGGGGGVGVSAAGAVGGVAGDADGPLGGVAGGVGLGVAGRSGGAVDEVRAGGSGPPGVADPGDPGGGGGVGEGVLAMGTPTVWVLARVLVAGPDDLPAARAAQSRIRVHQVPAGKTGDRVEREEPSPGGGGRFLDELRAAVAVDPPAPWHPTPPAGLGALLRDPPAPDVVAAGIERGKARVARGRGVDRRANGWGTRSRGARFGDDVAYRAAFAQVSLAGHLPAENRSYTRAFDGSAPAVLRFPPGGAPPVDGFWSLCVYGPDLFFVDNPLDRYSVGDRTPGLRRDPDGGLTLTLGAVRPAGAAASNWLPTPAGPCFLSLRAYEGRAPVVDATWFPPDVLPLRHDRSEPLA